MYLIYGNLYPMIPGVGKCFRDEGVRDMIALAFHTFVESLRVSAFFGRGAGNAVL